MPHRHRRSPSARSDRRRSAVPFPQPPPQRTASDPPRPERAGPGVLRVTCPEDLLALVPCVLGFHPEDSLVVVGLDDGAPFARVDLPREPVEVRFVVDEMEALVRRQRLRRLALVTATADADRSRAVAAPLLRLLERTGVGVPAAIRADGSRWFCLAAECGQACACDCPAEGTPYDISGHPFLARSVVAGKVIHRDRDALGRTLAPGDPDEIHAVAQAAARHADRLLGTASGPADAAREAPRDLLVREGRWLRRRVRRFVEDKAPLVTDDVARALVAIRSIEVRDVAWAEVTRGDAQQHVDLWSDVVRRTPRELLAAPASLLAFAAWLGGDGALAWCALDRCAEDDADYSMADLLGKVLASGMSPAQWPPMDPQDVTLFRDVSPGRPPTDT